VAQNLYVDRKDSDISTSTTSSYIRHTNENLIASFPLPEETPVNLLSSFRSLINPHHVSPSSVSIPSLAPLLFLPSELPPFQTANMLTLSLAISLCVGSNLALLSVVSATSVTENAQSVIPTFDLPLLSESATNAALATTRTSALYAVVRYVYSSVAWERGYSDILIGYLRCFLLF
jgi:hypothetical protein